MRAYALFAAALCALSYARPADATAAELCRRLDDNHVRCDIDATIDGTTLVDETFTLGDGTVTAAKLADSAVTSSKISDGTITFDDLHTNVNAAIEAGGAIGAGSITSTELASGAVTTAKIGDGEVTAAKLAFAPLPTPHVSSRSEESDEFEPKLSSEIELSCILSV